MKTASMSEIRSFAATVLLDGGADRSPMTLETACDTIQNWLIDDVEIPANMDPRDLMHVWNNLVGSGGLTDLEIHAHAACIPYCTTPEDLQTVLGFRSHVLTYHGQVIAVWYRYNNIDPNRSWNYAIYAFDTDDQSIEGTCTMFKLATDEFKEDGEAVKFALQFCYETRYLKEV